MTLAVLRYGVFDVEGAPFVLSLHEGFTEAAKALLIVCISHILGVHSIYAHIFAMLLLDGEMNCMGQ